MKKFIPYIIIAWSLLVFVGYNVLTVEAAEEKDMVDALREMKFVNDDEDDTGLKSIAIEQACKDNDGQWKDNSWCKFDKDKTGDEVEFEHQLEDRGLTYYYADVAEAEFSEEWDKYQQEKYAKEQDNQKKIEDSRNEGKRYVNPDGGAPLYEDELTEEEKDDYNEYKPPKEEQIEDWKNTVDIPDNLELNSPVLTVPVDKDDNEEEKDEK